MPDHDGPNHDRPESPAAAGAGGGNAFAERFLSRFHQEDDPYDSLEAELAGPWMVRPVGTDGFGVFRRWESPGLGDAPRAVFRTEAAALLAAAVLPALGREGAFRLARDPDSLGLFAFERGGEPWGATSVFDEALLGALNLATELARQPESLALLLRAAGPTALELAGRNLHRAVADSGRADSGEADSGA
jgi:hypothetical protein